MASLEQIRDTSQPDSAATDRKPQFRGSAVVVAICVAIWIAFFQLTWLDLRAYPLTDLGSRIVGARRMLLGMDPYVAPPVADHELQSRTPVTVTPSYLLMMNPLAGLPTEQQRVFWFAIDWLALCAIVLMCLRSVWASSGTATTIFLTALVPFSWAFRLHFARAQTYIELLFLTVIVAAAVSGRKAIWWGSIALAVLILFRPTYVVLLALLFLIRERHLLRKSIFVLATAGFLIVLLGGIYTWKSYFATVRAESSQHLPLALGVDYRPVSSELTDSAGVSGQYLRVYGFEHDRTFLGAFGFSPLRRWAGFHQSLLQWVCRVLLVATFLISLTLAMRYSGARSLNAKLAFVFFVPIALEQFGPQRYAYSDVLLLLPAFLVFSEAVKYRSRSMALVAVAAAHTLLPYILPQRSLAIASVAEYWVLLTGMCAFCIYKLERELCH